MAVTAQTAEQQATRQRIWRDVGFPVALFLALRVLLLGWGVLVTGLLPVNRELYFYLDAELLPSGHVLEPWQRWDTPIFQTLADGGYFKYRNLVLTPPLYPTLIGAVARVLGGQSMWAAMLVANVFGLFAFVNFYRLAQLELGDERDARRALIYLAVFPTAFYLFAAYTDPIFLAGAVGSLYYARRRRWRLAGLWGFFGAASRIVGVVLFLPLVWEGWRQWREAASPRRVPWSSVTGAALTIAGALVLPLYSMAVLHLSPLAPFHTQTERMLRTFGIPGQNIVTAIAKLLAHSQDMRFSDWFDLAFTLLFLALLVPVWRRLPSVYGVYYTTVFLFSLTITDQFQPLIAQCRYVLVLFPAFMVLAAPGEKPIVHRLIVYPSILLLLVLSGQFFIGGWVA